MEKRRQRTIAWGIAPALYLGLLFGSALAASPDSAETVSSAIEQNFTPDQMSALIKAAARGPRGQELAALEQLQRVLAVNSRVAVALLHIVDQPDARPEHQIKDLAQATVQFQAVATDLAELEPDDNDARQKIELTKSAMDGGRFAEAERQLRRFEDGEVQAAQASNGEDAESRLSADQHRIRAAQARTVLGKIALMQLRYSDAADDFEMARELIGPTQSATAQTAPARQAAAEARIAVDAAQAPNTLSPEPVAPPAPGTEPQAGAAGPQEARPTTGTPAQGLSAEAPKPAELPAQASAAPAPPAIPLPEPPPEVIAVPAVPAPETPPARDVARAGEPERASTEGSPAPSAALRPPAEAPRSAEAAPEPPKPAATNPAPAPAAPPAPVATALAQPTLNPPATPQAAQRPQTPEQAAPAARTPAQSSAISPQMLELLLSRGDAMLALGDVVSARRLYERAAAAGDARGATGAGKTYDPSFLAQIGARGIQPDATAAAGWYRKAVEAGDRSAAARLQQLSSQ